MAWAWLCLLLSVLGCAKGDGRHYKEGEKVSPNCPEGMSLLQFLCLRLLCL